MFYKKDIFTPYGPLTRENLPYLPLFGLSQGTFSTNKHNQFKEIRVSRNKNQTYKTYKHFGIVGIRKTYWPLIAPLQEKFTLPTPILFCVRVPSKLISLKLSFQGNRDSVSRNINWKKGSQALFLANVYILKNLVGRRPDPFNINQIYLWDDKRSLHEYNDQ